MQQLSINITSELSDIITEGAKTLSISRITNAQKNELADIYRRITNEELNLNCGGCIIKACVKVYNFFNENKYGSKEKKRNGKG